MSPIDARCLCAACERRTADTYVMTGWCRNCRTADIRISYRRGDTARPVDCPECGCSRTVEPSQLIGTDATASPADTDPRRTT